MTPHSPAGQSQQTLGDGHLVPLPTQVQKTEKTNVSFYLLLTTLNVSGQVWLVAGSWDSRDQRLPRSHPLKAGQICVPVLTPSSRAADSSGPVSSLTDGRRLQFSAPVQHPGTCLSQAGTESRLPPQQVSAHVSCHTPSRTPGSAPGQEPHLSSSVRVLAGKSGHE